MRPVFSLFFERERVGDSALLREDSLRARLLIFSVISQARELFSEGIRRAEEFEEISFRSVSCTVGGILFERTFQTECCNRGLVGRFLVILVSEEIVLPSVTVVVSTLELN